MGTGESLGGAEALRTVKRAQARRRFMENAAELLFRVKRHAGNAKQIVRPYRCDFARGAQLTLVVGEGLDARDGVRSVRVVWRASSTRRTSSG
jgi:hypothetical protein